MSLSTDQTVADLMTRDPEESLSINSSIVGPKREVRAVVHAYSDALRLCSGKVCLTLVPDKLKAGQAHPRCPDEPPLTWREARRLACYEMVIGGTAADLADYITIAERIHDGRP